MLSFIITLIFSKLTFTEVQLTKRGVEHSITLTSLTNCAFVVNIYETISLIGVIFIET
jgi:hypothetical protein